jgi:hypothetical protein
LLQKNDLEHRQRRVAGRASVRTVDRRQQGLERRPVERPLDPIQKPPPFSQPATNASTNEGWERSRRDIGESSSLASPQRIKTRQLLQSSRERFRHVATVYRLDHDRDLLLGRGRASKNQRVAIGRAGGWVSTIGNAAHHVKASNACRLRIAKSSFDRCAEFLFASGQRYQAALSRGPIARGQIEGSLR